MLRLYHHGTGQATPVRQARRGELRTYTVSTLAGEPVQAGDLRLCLVADLIRRVAQRHRLRGSAWQNVPGGSACDALNIYPAEHSASPPEPLDVRISQSPSEAAGHWVQAGWVRAGQVVGADGIVMAGPVPVSVPGIGARGFDPLALRLAFLQVHYRRPMTLTWDILAAADESLRWWRKRVADWARSPSKPMCAQPVAEIAAAFDDDLDTPAALGTLHELAEDGAIAPGAKFETFAYLDQLLGLDLAREVGQ